MAAYLAANDVVEGHLGNVVKFLDSPGLDPEYQILFLRQIRGSAPRLLDRLKPLPRFRALVSNLVNLKASLYR